MEGILAVGPASASARKELQVFVSLESKWKWEVDVDEREELDPKGCTKEPGLFHRSPLKQILVQVQLVF